MKQQLTYTDKKGLERLAYLPAKNPLSRRQKQILILSNQKLTDKQIGEALEIATKTVVEHKQKAFKLLDCHSTIDAVKLAIKHMYIEKD